MKFPEGKFHGFPETSNSGPITPKSKISEISMEIPEIFGNFWKRYPGTPSDVRDFPELSEIPYDLREAKNRIRKPRSTNFRKFREFPKNLRGSPVSGRKLE